MKRVLAFLGRRGIVYLLFVLALAVYQSRWIVDAPLKARASASELRQAAARLDAARGQAAAEVATAREAAQGKASAALDQQLAQARADLHAREAQRAENASHYVAKALNPAFMLSDGEWKLRVEAARYRVEGLAAIVAAAKSQLTTLASARQAAEGATVRCASATQAVSDFKQQPWIRRAWADWTQQQSHHLAAAQTAACDDVRGKQAVYASLLRAHETEDHMRAWANKDLPDLAAQFRDRAAQLERAADDSLGGRLARFWREHQMNAVLAKAFGLLVLSMLTPFLIRILFYYGLAPLAERRPAIRLDVAGASGAPIVAAAAASSTSVQVRLAADEELLVRQGFLQSASLAGPDNDRVVLLISHCVFPVSW